MDEVLQITSEAIINSPTMGRLYLVDLLKNNIPQKHYQFKPLLMGQEVFIDGLRVLITGIERFAMGEECNHTAISLKVSQIHG